MKSSIKFSLCMIMSFITISIHNCPTCIGKLDGDTPPFFSKEYDELFNWSEDDTLSNGGPTSNNPAAKDARSKP